MKVIGVAAVIATAALVTTAQSLSGEQAPPDIQILSKKWSKRALAWVTEKRERDPFPTPLPAPPPTTQQQVRTMTQFLYEVKVRNTGNKTIRGLWWDYVFTAPDTRQEVARITFYNAEKIRPNKEKMLQGKKTAPPMEVVSAAAAVETEHVVINCILYADGSVWRRPDFTGSCEPDKPPGRAR